VCKLELKILPNINRTQAPEITPGSEGMVPSAAGAAVPEIFDSQTKTKKNKQNKKLITDSIKNRTLLVCSYY